MFAKTSIQYRLGPLTGLWVLHTTVQGETDTCYFFRMGEAYYQVKLGDWHGRHYLCQVEGLPEDVEALEPPVPADTPVRSVLWEHAVEAAPAAVVLLMEEGTALRFELDEFEIGISLSVCKEAAEPAPGRKREAVELCGFDTPVIPLPESAVRARRHVMGAGVLVFILSILAGLILQVQADYIWTIALGMFVGIGLTLASARMPWRFRCPYCHKAIMRPDGGPLSTYVCPRCGNVCRSTKPWVGDN